MRHRKHRFQLGVKKEHREALMANLASALFAHTRIETTLAKAKALRPFAEKIITLAKKAQNASPEKAIHLRRLALARVRNKDVVNHLFNEQVKEFLERDGGYTRIYKIGTRVGDAAEMAIIQLISAADEGYPKRTKRKSAARTAPTPAAAAAAEASESEEADTSVATATEAEAPEAGDDAATDAGGEEKS